MLYKDTSINRGGGGKCPDPSYNKYARKRYKH